MKGLRLAYAGTPDFAVPALRALAASRHHLKVVITQPDRRAGRGRKLTASPVKQAAEHENISILQPKDINVSEMLSKLGNLDLDLLVVAAFGQLFGSELLSLPRFGCINIHASLLPQWRGASPIQHAILAGDTRSGVSIMQMAKRMDAGDIWLQRECEISPQDTAQSLHDKLAALSGDALLDSLDLICKGNVSAQPQNDALASYCTKLQKRDGLINWQENTITILRKIRAFYPWPGAYTMFNGRRLAITKAVSEVLTNSADIGPGTVLRSDKSGLVVATGDGVIRIQELKPAGGVLMDAASFANSNHIVQTVLGISE